MVHQILEATDTCVPHGVKWPKYTLATEIVLTFLLCCSLEALVKSANNASERLKSMGTPYGEIAFAMSFGANSILVFYIFCIGILFLLNAFQGLKKCVLNTSDEYSGPTENATETLGAKGDPNDYQNDPLDMRILVSFNTAYWRLLSVSTFFYGLCIAIYLAVAGTGDILRGLSVLGCSAITLILLRVAYLIILKIGMMTPDTVVSPSDTDANHPDSQIKQEVHYNRIVDQEKPEQIEEEADELISFSMIFLGLAAFVVIGLYISKLPEHFGYNYAWLSWNQSSRIF